MATHSNILDVLRAHAQRHPEKLLFAFLDESGRVQESYAYGSFLERVGAIAYHIAHISHLRAGDRVLLAYPPGLEMICGFFACIHLGLVPVPVYPPSLHGFAAALDRMNRIAADCQAAAVLTERSYHWSLKLHRARTRIARLSVDRDYTSGLPWMITSDAKGGAPGSVPQAHSDVLFLQYTSGSTSDPRGVVVTHDSVLANCDTTIDHVPLGVSWLPQYHDMGLIGAYLFLALKGGTTYGFSPVHFLQRPLLWLDTITKVRATISVAPNFAYAYCARADKIPDEALESLHLDELRVLMNGAEPVRPDVVRAFLQRFEPCGLKPRSFGAAYGLAEFTLTVSRGGRLISKFDARAMAEGDARPAPPGASAETRELVSCGRPQGTTEVTIVDVAGDPREAAPGRIGEIWLSGPSKCSGYWGRPDLTAEVFEARLRGARDDGRRWLRTGDLGFVADGELFVCGRRKDVIIVRGLNYYPQDVEAIVEENPAVRKGCVAAFAVERDGRESLVVVAEARSARRLPDTRSICGSVQERLGLSVDSFVFIRERTLPKTSSGKVRRLETRDRWAAGKLSVIHRVDAPASDREVESGRIQGDLVDRTPTDPLRDLRRKYGLTGAESGTLVESGFDSLRIAELAHDLQRYLKAQGTADLVEHLDLRWLQRIAICELFALLHDVTTAAPHARLRFRQAFLTLEREHRETERRMMRDDACAGVEISRPAVARAVPDGVEEAVLLTGGTGFFGPFLLQSLLEQTGSRIYVVVRASSTDHARARLCDGLASLGVDPHDGPPRLWTERVVPICGDIARPQLGLSDHTWSQLANEVGAIYHNGARVNYLADYASLREHNVLGTRALVRLASAGRPKVLNHVSSTFIFGWSTKATLFERDENRDMELLDFGYSQSKWVSEQIVLDAMRQGLRARVFRPALITPSVTGGGRHYDIAIRLLAFMIQHGMTTTAANQVSFSPADVVASNIVAISGLPDTEGRTFHVTRDTYSNMGDITRILGQILGRPFALYTLEEFVPRVIERCRPRDLLFPLLDFLVRSVDNITAMEFKRYNNDTYRHARDRSPFGRQDPPLEWVVAGIVRFMRRHGILDHAPELLHLEDAPAGGSHALR